MTVEGELNPPRVAEIGALRGYLEFSEVVSKPAWPRRMAYLPAVLVETGDKVEGIITKIDLLTAGG